MLRCINTHIQSLKVWLKYVLPWLKYSIFSRGLIFIGAPCIYSQLWTLATVDAAVSLQAVLDAYYW